MISKKQKRQGGYTLIELMLVLGIIAMMMLVESLRQYDEIERMQAQMAATQIKQLAAAIDKYMDINQDALQRMSDTTPANCTMMTDENVCLLDYEKALIKTGILSNWTPTNPWMSKYTVAITVNSMAPPSGIDCDSGSNLCPSGYLANDLKAIIVTTDPWMNGENFRMKGLGLAARIAGANAGVTVNEWVQGLNGGWTASIIENPALVSGQLAMYVLASSGKAALFVDTNGKKALAGNVNLGNNRMENVKDIEMNRTMTIDDGSSAYAYAKPVKISTMMPDYVLKGVFFGMDIEGGFPIEKPVCPDQEASTVIAGQTIRFVGTPKIKVTMTGLRDDQFGGYSWGQPALSPNEALSEPSNIKKARGGWNIWADGGGDISFSADPSLDYASLGTSAGTYSPQYWKVYARRFYDAGYARGEFMAEVYCYYDPVTILTY